MMFFCWLQMGEGEKGRRKEADVFWKHLLETIFSRKRESTNHSNHSVTDPWKKVSPEKRIHLPFRNRSLEKSFSRKKDPPPFLQQILGKKFLQKKGSTYLFATDPWNNFLEKKRISQPFQPFCNRSLEKSFSRKKDPPPFLQQILGTIFSRKRESLNHSNHSVTDR
jgi:hypothetical protein